MTLLIGTSAPDFTALAVMPDNSLNPEFSLSAYCNGRYAVLIFYSLDYSLVCPTEIIAINNRIEEFNKRQTAVIAISADSYLSHMSWRKLLPEQGGIGHISFPLVADMNKSIARGFDVLVNDSVSIRASFVLDRDGIVRHQSFNDFPIGRNIDELLRVVDAIQFHEATGDLCPANWQRNAQAIKAEDENAKEFLADYASFL